MGKIKSKIDDLSLERSIGALDCKFRQRQSDNVLSCFVYYLVVMTSVTRLGDFLPFGQLFKALGII